MTLARAGSRLLVAAGAVLLIAALAMPWYELRLSFVGEEPVSGAVSARFAETWIDAALGLAGLAALVALGANVLLRRSSPLFVAVAAGLVAIMLPAYRLIDVPGRLENIGPVVGEISLRPGLFLALLAGSMMLVGAIWAHRSPLQPRRSEAGNHGTSPAGPLLCPNCGHRIGAEHRATSR